MFSRLFSQKKRKIQAHKLYQKLVDQARSPAFYTPPLNVPDTMEGRFELILLHLFLVEHQLSQTEGQEHLRRILQETLINDMDRTLRELGIGDMSLGKEMKKIGAALLGRMQAYRDALRSDAAASALGDVISRNITDDVPASSLIADYCVRAHAVLGQAGDIANKPEALTFPDILIATNR